MSKLFIMIFLVAQQICDSKGLKIAFGAVVHLFCMNLHIDNGYYMSNI